MYTPFNSSANSFSMKKITNIVAANEDIIEVPSIEDVKYPQQGKLYHTSNDKYYRYDGNTLVEIGALMKSEIAVLKNKLQQLQQSSDDAMQQLQSSNDAMQLLQQQQQMLDDQLNAEQQRCIAAYASIPTYTAAENIEITSNAISTTANPTFSTVTTTANPSQGNHLTQKSYVDNQIILNRGMVSLNTSIGGNLIVQETGEVGVVSIETKAIPSYSRVILANVVSDNDATTKSYVDSKIASSNAAELLMLNDTFIPRMPEYYGIYRKFDLKMYTSWNDANPLTIGWGVYTFLGNRCLCSGNFRYQTTDARYSTTYGHPMIKLPFKRTYVPPDDGTRPEHSIMMTNGRPIYPAYGGVWGHTPITGIDISNYNGSHYNNFGLMKPYDHVAGNNLPLLLTDIYNRTMNVHFYFEYIPKWPLEFADHVYP